jgi:hypothetical protein
MALRPLSFGLRFQHRGSRVELRGDARRDGRYVVERSRSRAGAARREHPSLGSALRDFAQIWRGRLN